MSAHGEQAFNIRQVVAVNPWKASEMISREDLPSEQALQRATVDRGYVCGDICEDEFRSWFRDDLNGEIAVHADLVQATDLPEDGTACTVCGRRLR